MLYIESKLARRYNLRMESTKDWRRRALERLHEGVAPLNEIARRSGVNENYLSQIKAGNRNMTDKMAYRIETGMDLPIGFMSWPPFLHKAKDSASDLAPWIEVWAEMSTEERAQIIRSHKEKKLKATKIIEGWLEENDHELG